jgi:hypothetical protein
MEQVINSDLLKKISNQITEAFKYRPLTKEEQTIIELINDEATVIKKFPNGFKSWMETYHEIVEFIALDDEGETTTIGRVRADKGLCELYSLAESWADEFEYVNEGREWDGEFFDEIEQFKLQKNTL